MPGKLIDRIGRIIESVLFKSCRDLLFCVDDRPNNPLIDRLSTGRWIESRIGMALIHFRIARGIPKLRYKVPIALNAPARQTDIPALCRHGGQGKTQCICTILIDQIQRIQNITLTLRHFLALFIADQGMDINGIKGHFFHEVKSHHHHPRDPEKYDVKAGNQNIGGIVMCKFGGLIGPAQSRKWP